MNVLLAIDDSTCSEAAVTAVVHEFPAATAVRVIHVIEWPHDMPISLTFTLGPAEAECVLEAHEGLRQRAQALVARAADRLRQAGFNATTCVAEGNPRDQILCVSAEWPADTIVIGSHGRKGIDRLLLGSVSEAIVRRARCSVHVIREHAPARSVTKAS
jgi:nucleotide-binding universal stress UspA family protein